MSGPVPPSNGERRISRFERFMSRYSKREEELLDKIIDRELKGLKGNLKAILKDEVKKELMKHPAYTKLLRQFINILEKLERMD